MKNQKRKSKKEKGSLFIPAGLFLGLGWGFFYGMIVEGVFFGLGVGFLIYALVNLFDKNKK